ncbi:MAG: DUF853 family protein [Bdellovibrionales bacterium]|nr:DUF853 family protein [Bdellovibrionales bacterium]
MRSTVLGYAGTWPLRHLFMLPDSHRLTHTLVLGMTGSGKTTTLRSLIAQDIAKGYSVIVIDGKGDRSILGRAGPHFDFMLFGREVEGNLSFNPLLGPRDQVVDGFIAAMGFESEFYEGCARNLLYVYLRLMELMNIAPDLRELAKLAVDIESFAEEIKSLPADAVELRRSFNSLSALRAREYMEFHTGLSNRINALIHSRWMPRLGSMAPAGVHNIDLASAFEEPRCFYVGLQKLANHRGASILGKLLLHKIGTLSAERAALGADAISAKPLVSVYIDELAGLAYRGFEVLPQTVRSTKIMLTLSTQTLADLRAVSDEFAEQIQTNTGIKILHRLNSEKEADSWARLLGSKKTSGKILDRILTATNPKKYGRLHEEEVWAVHPNDLKNMPRGQAIVERDGSGRKIFARVRIVDLEAKLRRKEEWNKRFRTFVMQPFCRLCRFIGSFRFESCGSVSLPAEIEVRPTNASTLSSGDTHTSSRSGV